MATALARARRDREGLAVLFLDLDRFRVIEDSLGHGAGNDLLRGVAYRLRHCVREGDTIARLGADEFAVLIREVAQEEDALRVARKLLGSLRASFLLHEREVFVTASVGISLYPSDGEAAETLLKNADSAMEVNLSARQFQQPDLAGDVTRCLRETGLPPQALEIEITESVAHQDVPRSAEILRSLRAHGVRVSLDDFGTGYSSLSHLRDLPIDAVKLDQSFVRGVATVPADAAIARAIISMAHTLDLKVVAEGVETWEQLEFLRESGCDALQGHLFSAAVSAEEMESLLRRGHRLLRPGPRLHGEAPRRLTGGG